MSMGTNSINNLSSYLQSVLSSSFQGIGSTSSAMTANQVSAASSTAIQPDNTQLSPFAQMMSTLQQLQESNPTQYQQVTQQISTNLQTAAQTATSEGNTTAAAQLNQLSTDFSSASQSGQLPNMQDLAQAIGSGHHHHGHHHHASATDSNSDSSSSTSTTSSSSSLSQLLSQLEAASQSNTAQSGSLNPAQIIFQTLSAAGVGSANT